MISRNPEPPRPRVKYDLPLWIKEQIEDTAHSQAIDTSASQLAAYLLAYALHQLRIRPDLTTRLLQARSPARSLKFSANLNIPHDWRPTDGDN
jgi:hypothetical protein